MFRKSHAAKGLAWGLVSSSSLIVAIVAGVGATALGAWWISTHVSILWAVLFVLVGWTIPATVGYWAGLVLGMLLAIPVAALFGGPPKDEEFGAHAPAEVPTGEIVVSSGELWLGFAYGRPDERYAGKVVLISGPVRDVGNTSGSPYVLFDSWSVPYQGLENVRCVFVEDDAPRVAALSRGYDVTVRGTVHGFYDGEVELHSCTLEDASDHNIELTTASELWAAYDADEAAATEKYRKKVVRVSGVIRDLWRDLPHARILLDAGDDGGFVLCMCAKTESERVSSLSASDTVTVTGRVGYWYTRKEPQRPAHVLLGDCTLR